MNRRRMVHAIQAASKVGNYEEVAILPADTDPQIYLSRNKIPQPFYLICETDTVLSHLSGAAQMELRNSSVNRFHINIGDHIYIPAGTPHRVVPIRESVTIRYLPLRAGFQAASWFCTCGNEVRRYEWKHNNDIAALESYRLACAMFNADTNARICDACGALHPEVASAPLGMFDGDQRAGITDKPTIYERHRIPDPDPGIEPLKANIYESMAKSGAQLMPLFPYDYAGAIVPCGNVLTGSPGQSYGQFYHWNTVSEVVVCYGAHNSPLVPAQIIATKNLHGVNSRLTDETDPDACAVIVVTQHQAENGHQTEAMIARCAKCKTDLIRHEYDSSPPKDEEGTVVHQFPTTVGSARFADLHNEIGGAVCPACGYDNGGFPAAAWGWHRQVRQTEAANRAYRTLKDCELAFPD